MNPNFASMNAAEWSEHLFENLAYDQPDGFWEDDYTQNINDESAQTYDEWADSINTQMKARYYEYNTQDEIESQKEKEKAERKAAREKRRLKREADEIEILAFRNKQRLDGLREKNLERYFDDMKRFKRCFERKSTVDFRDVPWPVNEIPRRLKLVEELLTEKLIVSFLGKVGNDKALMKEQLLLWHPDKFMKFKAILMESEWDQVFAYSILVSKALTSMYNLL